ncbi:MAG: hypothetical protein ACJ746_27240 [Bryobacteraceae bacterium]
MLSSIVDDIGRSTESSSSLAPAAAIGARLRKDTVIVQALVASKYVQGTGQLLTITVGDVNRIDGLRNMRPGVFEANGDIQSER